jgi:hypothetical protein
MRRGSRSNVRTADARSIGVVPVSRLKGRTGDVVIAARFRECISAGMTEPRRRIFNGPFAFRTPIEQPSAADDAESVLLFEV